jgi:hypothetical protein
MGCAEGSHRKKKKELADALGYAAQKGSTAHEKLKAVHLAQLVNLLSGGPVIAPWEVEGLDDEWTAVFEGMSALPKMRESYQAFDRKLEEIRAAHPTYRKYLTRQ